MRVGGLVRDSMATSWLDKLTNLAVIAAALAVVVLAVRTMWPRSRPVPRSPAIPSQPLSTTNAAVRGAQSATVGLIIFSDFQCPFCRRFVVETLPTIDREYVDKGLVRLFFRHLPLPSHSVAFEAAVAAECGRRLGAFWQVHDWLFAEPNRTQQAGFSKLAPELGLDLPSFSQCLKDGDASNVVSFDRDTAGKLGLTSTPTFMLGLITEGSAVRTKKVLSGALPVATFRSELDTLLVTK